MTATEPPRCFLCRHFQITFDRSAPRACAVFGFKSVEFPSAVVLRESGKPCVAFEKKAATSAAPRA